MDGEEGSSKRQRADWTRLAGDKSPDVDGVMTQAMNEGCSLLHPCSFRRTNGKPTRFVLLTALGHSEDKAAPVLNLLTGQDLKR